MRWTHSRSVTRDAARRFPVSGGMQGLRPSDEIRQHAEDFEAELRNSGGISLGVSFLLMGSTSLKWRVQGFFVLKPYVYFAASLTQPSYHRADDDHGCDLWRGAKWRRGFGSRHEDVFRQLRR